MNGWMSLNDPLDDTKVFNQSGLVSRNFILLDRVYEQTQEQMMATKAGAIWGGYLVPWDKFVYGVSVGQKYLVENTTLGIPAIFQSEGMLPAYFRSPKANSNEINGLQVCMASQITGLSGLPRLAWQLPSTQTFWKRLPRPLRTKPKGLASRNFLLLFWTCRASLDGGV